MSSCFLSGQVVLEDRKAYVWHPDLYSGKPFLCPAEEITVTVREGASPQVAARVHDYTPYFDETITLKPALVSADGGSFGPICEGESDSDEWASRESLEGGTTTYASDILEACDETFSGDDPQPLPLGPFSGRQQELNAQRAKTQMMSHSGWTASGYCEIRDYVWTGSEPQETCESLSAKITATLKSIPDGVWISRTRKM